MSLTGFWKGEYITDKDSTLEHEEIPVPTLLEIKKHDMFNQFLEGIFMEDEEISGISESAEILGSVRIINEISFTRRLSRLYYRKEDGITNIVNVPHPEIYYEGKLINSNYIVGTWKTYHTYRKVDDLMYTIFPASGYWWVKRIR